MAATFPQLHLTLFASTSHSCLLSPIAVVGCRPDSDEFVVEHHFVAIHYELMGAGNEIDVVRVVEVLGDVWTE